MDRKLVFRIGAAAFLGIAVAMTLVELRDDPQPAAEPERLVLALDGDPLPAQLAVCAEMGELALSSPDCRAAWAEKRRRFFDVAHPEAYDGLGSSPPGTAAN